MNLAPALSDTLLDRDADTRAAANKLARCALGVLERGFPYQPRHLILSAADLQLPSEIHPVFHGCYDWPSSVHMHWSLLRLRTMDLEAPLRAAIHGRFNGMFRSQFVEQELAYVNTPGRENFERPYGWAWLLKLQAELIAQSRADANDLDVAIWRDALQPFAEALAEKLGNYLASLNYAIRSGSQANTAFSMLLALDYAEAVGNTWLHELLNRRALSWFGADEEYPSRYEPGGADFLSAGLCEAVLMKRLLAPAAFAGWWRQFLPDDVSSWLEPAIVSDRCDAQFIHLDGLNLSRAWCLESLTRDRELPYMTRLAEAAAPHWRAAWPHVTRGDFVATHWLVSFALLR